MAVGAQYFYPLWPLLAVLAASLIHLGRGAETDAAGQKAAAFLCAAVFVPLAALEFFVIGLVLAFPFRSADALAWDCSQSASHSMV
mgnify:CR=1 FL=1